MADWYRNSCWDAEVAAAFEAKLARSRSQKAQYMRIQGSMLKDSDPEAALGLLRRCIDEGDPAFIAHAMLDMAHAHYRLGRVADALDTLEALLEQQRREPRFRTSAAFDYPFLVALHDDERRFERAMDVLDEAEPAFLPDMVFQGEAARAIILDRRGDGGAASAAARRALEAAAEPGWIPGFPLVGAVPTTANPFLERLNRLAAAGGA